MLSSRETLLRIVRQFTYILLITGAVTLIFEFFFNGFRLEMESVVRSFFFNGLLTALLWVGNGWMAQEIQISWIKEPVKHLWVSLVLTLVYSLSVAIIAIVVFRFVLVGSVSIDLIGKISPSYYITVVVVTLVISLFMHGREFLLQWKESILELERLQQAKLSAQYEALKNQVNPHFLFNSLNVLSGLVYIDPDQSVKFIRQLASVYRYVLDSANKELVTLEEELEALRAYLFLLHIRFADALQVEVQEENLPLKSLLIPLTLQMLVENAVKHNILSKNQPLLIVVNMKDEQRISVSNTLLLKEIPVESMGIGLDNLQQRYKHLAGQLLVIQKTSTHFCVSVPIIPSL